MITHMFTSRSTSDWFFFQTDPGVKQKAKRVAAPGNTARSSPASSAGSTPRPVRSPPRASARASSKKKRTPPEREFGTPSKKARKAHSPKASSSENEPEDPQEDIIPELRHAGQITSHDMDLRREQNIWTVEDPPLPGVWTEEQVHDHNRANAKLDWLMGKYSTMSSCVPRCYHENCNVPLKH
jgi:hypothetical protein